MIDINVEFTSLCRVSVDQSDQPWLNRLADINNGEFTLPVLRESEPRLFGNRPQIFHNDGPAIEDAIGVWRWTAVPNHNNAATDYVQSFYQPEYNPIRVFPVYDISNDEQLVSKLCDGIIGFYYDCDTLFVYKQKSGFYRGVLCKRNEFQSVNGTMRLCENIFALPVFVFPPSDVLFIKKYLQFLKKLTVGKSNNFITIGDISEVIKTLVLERLTWPLYKECISGTKNEWRHCKVMMERICGESLYEAVALKLKCSPGQAKLSVKEFTERAGSLIDAGDVDSDVLAELAMHHEGLKVQCEAIVEKKWKAEHKAELDAASAEIEGMRKQAEVERAAAKKKLQALEQERQKAEKDQAGLVDAINASQKQLDSLLSEIEQYESLGKDTLDAVRARIAEAQKDMAGFIADLSVVLPQTQSKPVGRSVGLWKYELAPEPDLDDEELDISETWKEEYAQICGNLSGAFGVNNELSEIFGAFLYAVYIHNEHILVAGPGGRELADVLSKSVYATDAGHVILGNEYDVDILDGVQKYSEPIVAIHNMFNKGWADTLPQTFSGSRKHIIWSAPYAEDIVIEPKGLFNYALPLLSECFIESMPKKDVDPETHVWAAKRSPKFKAYTSGKKLPLRLASWKRLKLSKLLLNRMECILSDVKRLVERESSYKDIEVLLGVLPLAVLTGKTDILSDLLENEKGISSAVRAEVLRYIEEE